ncbi:MAG: hypothetical protein QM315_11320 [Bacillota bacterium]|jgi:predicted lysophospholipase L1 biosynthesis ABC-type transport system permease subunit|nr:hypothetical protein [Bacillota bacterium]NLV62265.1 hypothetical protein [Clostridiaceae bacterium]
MFKNDCRKLICLASSILGLILVGLGVYLLVSGLGFAIITIGTIVAGVVLLVLSSVTKCIKVPCLFCLLLLIISIFLIIAGIISLLLVDIVIGLIFIGLGVISTILTALCLFINLCCVTVHKGHI